MTPTFMTQKVRCIVLLLIDSNGKRSRFIGYWEKIIISVWKFYSNSAISQLKMWVELREIFHTGEITDVRTARKSMWSFKKKEKIWITYSWGLSMFNGHAEMVEETKETGSKSGWQCNTGYEMHIKITEAWVWVLTMSFTSSVTLSKLFNLSEP